MEAEFLKERLDRFLKIIPAEYKIADPMKKSPKGWTTTIERIGKVKKSDKPKIIEDVDEKKEAKKAAKTGDGENKSKKKSLDDLLDIEGGSI
jgi:hypothetical protein